MDRRKAEKIVDACNAAIRELDRLAAIVREGEPDPLSDELLRQTAHAIADLHLEICEPLWQRFPDLRPQDMPPVRSAGPRAGD
jgi:hypothetical protein